MTDTAETLADRLEGIALAGQEMTLVIGPDEALELSRMLRGELSTDHERRWLSLDMRAANFWARRERIEAAWDRIAWAVLIWTVCACLALAVLR